MGSWAGWNMLEECCTVWSGFGLKEGAGWGGFLGMRLLLRLQSDGVILPHDMGRKASSRTVMQALWGWLITLSPIPASGIAWGQASSNGLYAALQLRRPSCSR